MSYPERGSRCVIASTRGSLSHSAYAADGFVQALDFYAVEALVAHL